TANSCYIHVECPPCVFHGEKRLETGAEPLRPGLRFTAAQHNTVARLAVDIARRNGWPMNTTWWRTPRLLGHEDLTPIARHDSRGGWDPGYLREKPYFDWDYVYGMIEQILGRSSSASTSGSPTAALSSLFSSLGSLAGRFLDFVKRGQEHLALALAYGQGQINENKLTNLVFFARHPELGGRRILAHEKDLAQEWLQIRDQLVRPFLQSRSREELFLADMNQALVTEAMQEELELAEIDQHEADEFEDEYDVEEEEEQLAWPPDDEAMAHAYDEDEGQWADEELEEEDWLAEENESDVNLSYGESELLEEAFAEDYSELEAIDEWDEAFLDEFDEEDEQNLWQDETPPLSAELLSFAQTVLNVAEGEKLKIDGKIGKFTRGALARFRKKYGLGAGSALDGATQLVLAQRVLEELAQQSLFAKNGRLDPATEQAIIEFKAKHNLPRSAAIDAQTRSALLAALSRRGGTVVSVPTGSGQTSSTVKTKHGSWGGWQGRATAGTIFINKVDIANKYDLAVAVAADVETSGAYDKVQMYDRGILSWGIKQWTLHRGSLQKALAFIKNELAAAGQNSLWTQLFPGIDIRSNKLVVNGKTYDTPKKDGDAADLALRRLFKGSVDPKRYDATRVNRWLERFALAGRHPAIQKLQFAYARNDLKANLNRQLGKVLRYRKDIRASQVGSYQRIGDYIEDSPFALALFNGMETQNPKWTYRYLKRIVDRLAARNGGIYDFSRWSTNWRAEFATELQKEFAASGVACWGKRAVRTKDKCKKRTSRTDKLLRAYKKYSA
ncbi:MAG: hypothetical protein R3293_27305, partial [Candidatus Promineifilaceae bacterium]|nr:hypothetical protein [Candidatus Promineifilaceae bacterium]